MRKRNIPTASPHDCSVPTALTELTAAEFPPAVLSVTFSVGVLWLFMPHVRSSAPPPRMRTQFDSVGRGYMTSYLYTFFMQVYQTADHNEIMQVLGTEVRVPNFQVIIPFMLTHLTSSRSSEPQNTWSKINQELKN